MISSADLLLIGMQKVYPVKQQLVHTYFLLMMVGKFTNQVYTDKFHRLYTRLKICFSNCVSVPFVVHKPYNICNTVELGFTDPSSSTAIWLLHMFSGIHYVQIDYALDAGWHPQGSVGWPLLQIHGHYLQYAWIIHYFWQDRSHYTFHLIRYPAVPEFSDAAPARKRIFHHLVAILWTFLNFIIVVCDLHFTHIKTFATNPLMRCRSAHSGENSEQYFMIMIL